MTGRTATVSCLNGFWVQQWVPRMMIGKIDFAPNGEWQHIVINVDEALNAVLGDTSHFVREVLIGDTRTFASGWWYYFDAHHHYLDDFKITKGSAKTPDEYQLVSGSGLKMFDRENRVPAFNSEIVDGVKATCRLTKLGYFPWEQPQLQMWVTNLSDKPMRIATENPNRLWELNITTADGKPITDGWQSAYWSPAVKDYTTSERPPRDLGLPFEAGHYMELKPGESWSLTRNLHDFINNWAQEKQKAEGITELPNPAWLGVLKPGAEYNIAVRYNSAFNGEEFGYSAWTGTAQANSVVLSLIGVPTVEEELDALVTSLDAVRRAKACAQLGKAKCVEAIPALCKALVSDDDGDVRLNAAWALGEFPRVNPEKPETAELVKPCVEALIKALDDENWRVGEYAAISLGRLGDRSATPHLVARLDNPSKWVRRRTADALNEMLDPASITKLGELMKDPSREVRLRVLNALQRIAGNLNGPVEQRMNIVRNVQRELSENEKRIAEVNGKLEPLQKTLKEKQDERSGLEKQLGENETKAKALADETNKLEQELVELKKDEQANAEAIKTHDARIAEIAKETKQIADGKADAERKIGDLKRQEEQTGNQVKNLEQQIADLGKRVDETRNRLAEANESVSDLQGQFKIAFDAMAAAAGDEYWEIRRNFVGGLVSFMWSAEVGPFLIDGMGDGNERVRESAIGSMGDFLGKLGGAANDKGNAERAASAQAAIDQFSGQATPLVTECLGDYYDTVRRKAVEQYGRITGKDLVETTGHDAVYWFSRYPRPGDDRYKH